MRPRFCYNDLIGIRIGYKIRVNWIELQISRVIGTDKSTNIRMVI
jgi:hypothetical protein